MLRRGFYEGAAISPFSFAVLRPQHIEVADRPDPALLYRDLQEFPDGVILVAFDPLSGFFAQKRTPCFAMPLSLAGLLCYDSAGVK
jgi:hypothetical protein